MKTFHPSSPLSLPRVLRGLVMLLLVGLLAGMATAVQAAGWRIQIIDSGGDVGRFNAIALDTGNRPHISYQDETNRDLKYARWDGASWQIATVESAGDVGAFSSLALDTFGFPHIAYGDYTNGRRAMKYARWDGSAWHIEIVVNELFASVFGQSLALDNSNQPHIAYWDDQNRDLKYARWDGAAWQIEIVDGVGSEVGNFQSLKLDSNNRPHISYRDITNRDLKYARWDGTTWQLQTVDSAGDVGSSTTLALDSSDRPHIAYYDNTNHQVKYAHWDGSTWRFLPVANANLNTDITVALDSSDQPYLSFRHPVSGVLLYARLHGSVWQITTVDSNSNGGLTISLALDSHNRPHISYQDTNHLDLKYATFTASDGLVWQNQTVENEGDVGKHSSLKLDSNDKPVMTYRDDTNDKPKLTKCTDSSCNGVKNTNSVDNKGDQPKLALDSNDKPVITYHDKFDGDLKVTKCGDDACGSGNSTHTVDNNNVGQHNDLKLDSNDKPVISYHDETNGDLKLAHCGDAACSGGNTIQTVDSTNDVGEDTSLALDSNGHPVISYYDVTNGDLKVTHCGDATCSSGNVVVTVDSAGDVGRESSLALDANGYPVISYYDATNGDLKVVHCGDATCSSGNVIVTVDRDGDVGRFTSLLLNSSGHPVISYYDITNSNLKVVQCGDATCSSGNLIETVDSIGDVGQYSSLALDSNGNPVITYYDATNGDLKLVRLTSDATPPVITAALSPATPNGQNGWYVSDVTVSFTCADEADGSGLATNTVAGATLTTDGANQSVTNTGQCLDNTGNGAVPVTVSGLNIDKTPPTLAPVIAPNPVLLNAAASVTSGATDGISGLASESCGALDTSTVGVKSVTCTATDNAGNTANATVSYQVIYAWTNFFQPVDSLPTVNTVNAGVAIPVRFGLGGDYGLTIFASGYPASQQVSCGSGGSGSSAPIEETLTAGNSSLHYDATTQSYTYIWKTDKAWAGTCRLLLVRFIDGAEYSALFQFNGNGRSAGADGEAEVVQQLFLPLVNR